MPSNSILAQKQAINKGAARKKTKASLNAKIKSIRSSISTLYVDLKDGLLEMSLLPGTSAYILIY